MRGWSHRFYYMSNYILICPAYAGMIPLTLLWILQEKNLSRVCGDDPWCLLSLQLLIKFVPRMRGWSYFSWSSSNPKRICPAYAGMILFCVIMFILCIYLSRVCGDDPDVKCLKAGIEKICPAYAGMILNLRLIKLIPSYLSRVCGDDPQS